MYKCVTCKTTKQTNDNIYWVFDGESNKPACSEVCAKDYKEKAIIRCKNNLYKVQNQEIKKAYRVNLDGIERLPNLGMKEGKKW